jgi:tRNA1Val (adenine37-N6)-methyltransferase
MAGIFKFKQFEVDQTGCAMRINTDGVLLAALSQSENPKHVLDIGTGTGVIALMLAQRFENAYITAVEIDETASLTAQRNFDNSVFYGRLAVKNIAIEDYVNEQNFDLIITNSPYFVNDLKSAEIKKGIARHASEQFFDNLIVKVDKLLNDNGSFWCVLPVTQAVALVEKARGLNLFLTQQIHFHSDESKPEFRRIICLKKRKETLVSEHFYIYQSEKIYTQAYQELMKPFFLGY